MAWLCASSHWRPKAMVPRHSLETLRPGGPAGSVDAGAVDGGAVLVRTAARAGDDVEVAQIGAAEAETGDHGQGNGHVLAMGAARIEDRHPAAAGVGDPHR